MEANLIHSCV